MTLFFRRTLYIFFILAFLIITPTTILFANGYKFKLSSDFKTMVRLEKTGTLVLETEPDGARIRLNNVLEAEPFSRLASALRIGERRIIATPAKIKNLSPGEYDVTLELDGYWPWKKKLRIEEGKSTFAEDVKFFQKNTPQLISKAKIKALASSPDRNQLAFLTNDQVMDLSISGDDAEILPRPIGTSSAAEIKWSGDGKKIIAGSTVFNTSDGRLEINIKKYLDAEREYRWPLASSEIVYYLDKKKNGSSLNSFNLKNYENRAVYETAGQILDFLNNGQLYLIVLNDNKSELLIKDETGRMIRKIDLPLSRDYRFVPGGRFTSIIDRQHDIFYLFNEELYIPVVAKKNDVKLVDWVDRTKFLYANDSEIYLYYLENQESVLLARVSSPIKFIAWHPNNNYIIFATADAINAIELDDREKRSITELAQLERLEKPFLNATGNQLYFIGKTAQGEGLYRLGL